MGSRRPVTEGCIRISTGHHLLRQLDDPGEASLRWKMLGENEERDGSHLLSAGYIMDRRLSLSSIGIGSGPVRCSPCPGQVNSVKHREEGSCTSWNLYWTGLPPVRPSVWAALLVSRPA